MSQITDSLFPSANPIPDKLINASVYRGTDELLGTATVTLPEIAYMTESMQGLGLAGPVETPVLGHFQNMTAKITWNTVNRNAVSLLMTESHQLNVRASVQRYDAGTGKLSPQAVKLVMNTLPKKVGLGKTEPGKKMDSENELEVMYLKLWIGGMELLEIDKLNFVCRILGKDQLADVRRHLGKEA